MSAYFLVLRPFFSRLTTAAGLFGVLLPVLGSAEIAPPPPLKEQVIRIYQTDARYNYRTELLQLALRRTEQTHGAARIAKLKSDITNKRGRSMLVAGHVDVVSYAATPDLEEELLSVDYPILNGLLGFRAFLINQSKQQQFSELDNVEQLKALTAGSGTHWADTEILEDNQFKVMTSARYVSLFDLLSKNRIDYFPRGLSEIWQELNQFQEQHKNLHIESSKALFYPFPVYFYVAKGNSKLQRRIHIGLKKAALDGSMKKLFQKHHQHILEELKATQRQVFCLENPHIAQELTLETDWWWPAQQAGPLCTTQSANQVTEPELNS